MLHYKQIQYEFCSKENILSPNNNVKYHTQTLNSKFYTYTIRYWDRMKTLIEHPQES